ncbi:LytTR family two component transcriptional regulator [Lachnotalea glycerini]|uniref:Stage 0 sporulation protein A homolog n=2 Tax=Lachnotalea glycerini TaxID=1763509 RepID=A0A255IT83_9FIRM|nr:LytTR family DNA-binding domain-containing protein [Lachnotalea glycerini]PXV93405.1 LytTR family two component transcriptional regulator [Lachnotalea glycerini]RDY31875.1 DNA-binding response regulator [Lachnotalea glycerini]
MLQIAICDDDERMRCYIENLIKNEAACRLSVYGSGKELIAEGIKFDILFLDIRMVDLNGIETAKIIRKTSDAIIIFITALKEYVFDAFDLEAFHYLLKPIDETKFKEVFKRAVDERLLVTRSEPLIIKAEGIYRRIEKDEILYAENEARKIILHTRSENITFYEKMDDLEQKIGGQFFRCHRGYLINLDAVTSYDMTHIRLKSGEEVCMAKQKYNSFVTAYMEYLRRR